MEGTKNQCVKRRHDGQCQNSDNHGERGEEQTVDDLVVASMHAAVAMTWCAGRLVADDESIDDSSSDDASDDSSDSEEEEEEISNFSDKFSPRDTGGDGVFEDGDVVTDRGSNDQLSDGEKENKTEVSISDGTFINKNNNGEVVETSVAMSSAGKDDCDEDDEDVSDIDLAEHLADMEDDDEDEPQIALQNTRKGRVHKNQSSMGNDAYNGALRTENEIDPYRCPTEKLEKLNVFGVVGIDELTTAARDFFDTDVNGALIVNEKLKKELQIAGMVRSFIPAQRTVVVDSFIPPSLLQTNHRNVVSSPLGEGSMLVVISTERQCENDERKIVPITLNEMDDTMGCRVQILGKIIEIFGPIQRPFYAIRLPDPPKSEVVSEGVIAQDRPNHEASSDKEGRDSKEGTDFNPTSTGHTKNEEVAATNPNDTLKCGVFNLSDTKYVTAAGALLPEDASYKPNTDEKNSNVQEDPWSSDGKLSIMLKSFPSAAVYSLTNYSKLINTNEVMQISGKGCDASNMYDEELGANEQQYFSDDEQEREAKRGNRKPRQANYEERGAPINGGRAGGGRGSGRDGRGRGRGRDGRGQTHRSCGLHSSPRHFQQQQQQLQYSTSSYLEQPLYNHQLTPLAPMYPYIHGNLPYQQGMYQSYPQQQQQQQQYQQQYQQQPASNYGVGQPYHFPPHGQATLYGVPPPPPPPPPPPALSNLQPQVAETDTVYYDYT
jgi:rRNA processing protein Gar1